LKQLSRAGQAGMSVAEVSTSDPDIQLIAISGGDTKHPDALIVFNMNERRRHDVSIRLSGTAARSFDGYVTGFRRKYEPLGTISAQDGTLQATVPAQSVVTFFAKP
jgi:hypothetical protein